MSTKAISMRKKSLHAVFSLPRRSNSVVTVYIQASLPVIQTHPTAQQIVHASLRCMHACIVSFLLVPCVLVSCALLFRLVSIRTVQYALLSPRHDLGAHLLQTSLSLAVREERNSLNGLVNVVLRQCARLLEPIARQYDITGL
jgi:hypothetical protein